MNTEQQNVPFETWYEGKKIEQEPVKSARTARSRWRRKVAAGLLLFSAGAVTPPLAHGQFLSIFDSIFSSIQNDMGASLKAINQISQRVQQLYQTTVWPLAAINQARGFVSSSIDTFRTSMAQVFNTPFTSAVSPGPQQFESILHSRQYTQIPALQTSFTANYGAVPQANAASPQDRVLMDMDDALGQQNLKTTLVSDQASDLVLRTAEQMEDQVAVSTPGSNPYLTAQAQVANLRCQAFLRKMLTAELRQEAGRVAHQNVLTKRRSTATGNIGGLISGALTSH